MNDIERDLVETAQSVPSDAFTFAFERWIAQRLETHPLWSRRGRWWDGVIFYDCRTTDVGHLVLRGFIYSIDQEQLPFRAALTLGDRGLEKYELQVAEPLSPHAQTRWRLERFAPEWRFVFSKP